MNTLLGDNLAHMWPTEHPAERPEHCDASEGAPIHGEEQVPELEADEEGQPPEPERVEEVFGFHGGQGETAPEQEAEADQDDAQRSPG